MSNLSITSSLYPITQTSSVTTSKVGAAGATSIADILGGAKQTGDTKSISPAGQLFSDLQALQQSDPAKFKQVLADIAKQLNSASQATGTSSSESKILSDLANTLQQVSDTGDLSSLLPKKKHHAHHAQAAGNQQANLLQLLNNNNNGTQQTTGSTSIQDILSSLVSAVSGTASAATSSAV